MQKTGYVFDEPETVLQSEKQSSDKIVAADDDGDNSKDVGASTENFTLSYMLKILSAYSDGGGQGVKRETSSQLLDVRGSEKGTRHGSGEGAS